MHAAFAQPVSYKLDLSGETSGERPAGRRVPNTSSFDSMLQASEPAPGTIKAARRGKLTTSAMLPDTRAIVAGRESDDLDLADAQEKRMMDDSDDAGWAATLGTGAREDTADPHASDKPIDDADDAAATSASETTPTDEEDENTMAAATLAASLLIGAQTSMPTGDNPGDALAVTAAPPTGSLTEEGNVLGQAAPRSPAEAASPHGGDNQISATVQVAGDGLSSRPSSLLVPQAVLAETTEAPASGGPGDPAFAATSPGETAPSPIAVAGAAGAGAGGAGGEDLPQSQQGFSAATAGGQAVSAEKADRLLTSKPVAAQVAMHVGKAAKAGVTRIDIALEPASLGKVEVHLDFGRDGRVAALFVAESREALDALRADARTLERALSEAGVKTDSASLDFSLREHGNGSGGSFSDRHTGVGGRSTMTEAGDSEAEVTPSPDAPKPRFGDRRLDIHA